MVVCGIAGFVTTAPEGRAIGTLGRMADAIHHRGPDDFGFYHDPWAHLGQRRLAIVDVQGGHQPMSDKSGALWIAFNGEIYNHTGLRPALEQAGHRFETRSDTETILHAYQEHGADCLRLLRGMFAFAIWDARRQRLFCARDRLGIKPFYYYWDGRLFAFASEIKALLEHPSISPVLDEDVLPEMLAFGYTSSHRTLFGNIRKLMPAHRMFLDVGSAQPELKCERYWEIPLGDDCQQDFDEREWIPETRRRLEESVEMHLMSDVPLGVLLSGGLDSSAIAALAQRAISRPVETFAVGYSEARFSELSYARQTASALGANHRETIIGIDDFFGALGKLIWHEDEPIAWPSSVPLYFVSKLAAQHVKVVLTGEGSDELFAGYERYRWLGVNERWAARYETVPTGIRRSVREWIAISPLLGAGLRRKLRHTVLGRELGFESLFLEKFLLRLRGRPARKLYAPLERTAGSVLAGAHAVLGPANVSCRAAHEAGPDEHGGVHREPGAFSGSHLRRVRRANSGWPQDSRPHAKAYPQGRHERFAAARHPAPQKDGISHASRALAARSTGRAFLRRFALAGRPGGGSLRSGRSGHSHRSSSFGTGRRHRSHLAASQPPDLGRPVSHWPARASVGRVGGACMKILWVKADFLHPTNGGGQIRTLETLKWLHRRHEIHFAALDLPEPGAGFRHSSEYCTKAYAVSHPVPQKSGPRYWAELATGTWKSMPLPVLRYRSPALLRLVEVLTRLESFDAIVCDFLASAANIPQLGNAVLFQHNVESAIWKRHTEHAPTPWHRAFSRAQYEGMLRYEAEVCRKAKNIIAVSDADASAMRSLYGATRVSSVATGVDIEYFAPPRTVLTPRQDLMFLGAMDWRPNIEGLTWFAGHVLPLILARAAGLLVGRSGTPSDGASP